MNHQELKSILDAADIRHVEASELFHISRSTLYDWLRGREPKSKYLYENATKIALLIRRGTAAGLLPPKDVHGKDRLFAIQTALRTLAANR